MAPRTYYDKLGNLREYGTGRLLRRNARPATPAPAPGSRPGPRPNRGTPSTVGAPKPSGAPKFPGARTYKDRNGKVHLLKKYRKPGGTPGAKPAGPRPRPGTGGGRAQTAASITDWNDPSDPFDLHPDETLEQRVEKLLGGYDNDMTSVANYAAGQINQDTRLGAGYDQLNGKLQATGGTDGAPVDPVMQQYLNEMKRANQLQTGEQHYATRLRAEEEIRSLREEKQGARHQLAEQLRQEDTQKRLALAQMLQENNLTMADLNLRRDQMTLDAAMAQAANLIDAESAAAALDFDKWKFQTQEANDLAMNQANNATRVEVAGINQANKKPPKSDSQKNLEKLVSDVRKRAMDPAKTKNPFGAAAAALKAGPINYPPDKAALLALRWFPGELKRYGRPKAASMLRKLGVSGPTTQRILTQLFGRAPGNGSTIHGLGFD